MKNPVIRVFLFVCTEKKMRNIFLISATITLSSSLTLAKKINCQVFNDIIAKANTQQSIQNKNLKQNLKQIESNKKAIDDYNKNCRNASGAQCNPALYSMMASQMPILEGQRSQAEAKIANLKLQASKANEDLIGCKASVKISVKIKE